jgi:hypothetical protein
MEYKLRRSLVLAMTLALMLLPACQTADAPACPTVAGTLPYLTIPPEVLPTPVSAPASTPVSMEIGGKIIPVDKVVEGPLCNDTWSGTVYVTCNVQVYPWEEQPTFLKNCNLAIAPGTVVYVAYHNDTAYYNGCSCHTGEIAGP